jgi:hypothetical protein
MHFYLLPENLLTAHMPRAAGGHGGAAAVEGNHGGLCDMLC